MLAEVLLSDIGHFDWVGIFIQLAQGFFSLGKISSINRFRCHGLVINGDHLLGIESDASITDLPFHGVTLDPCRTFDAEIFENENTACEFRCRVTLADDHCVVADLDRAEIGSGVR